MTAEELASHFEDALRPYARVHAYATYVFPPDAYLAEEVSSFGDPVQEPVKALCGLEVLMRFAGAAKPRPSRQSAPSCT